MDRHEAGIWHGSHARGRARCRARHARRGTHQRRRVIQVTQVAPCSSADEIGVICRRTDADGLGGSAKEVAHVVAEGFDDVGGVLEGLLRTWLPTENLVVDDIVVRRSGSTLDGGVSLEEEVPIAGLADAAVDNGAVLWVPRPVRVFLSGWVEAHVVALADDDDSDVGFVGFCYGGRVDFLACLAEGGELVLQNEVVLPFGYPVPIYQYVLW
jgi:hypothetical protein